MTRSLLGEREESSIGRLASGASNEVPADGDHGDADPWDTHRSMLADLDDDERGPVLGTRVRDEATHESLDPGPHFVAETWVGERALACEGVVVEEPR
jgi:hypothetical protein